MTLYITSYYAAPVDLTGCSAFRSFMWSSDEMAIVPIRLTGVCVGTE